jgi:adenylyltransferase/sulfurtransferase
MDDRQLLRYSRHILLPQIGIEGQEKLRRARVLIIGLGGLGSPAAMYLAASGVGQLVLTDPDQVDLTNLQRQIVHTTDAVGEPKVASAARTLRALNPEVTLTLLERRLDEPELSEQARLADVVVDGSDNFETRFAVNRACVAARKPLVSGAVVRFEGQVAVFRPDLPDGSCYRCLYHESDEPPEPCAQFGVLAPAAGIIGAIQAAETLKLLLGLGGTLSGRLLAFDALAMEWRELRLKRDLACPACGTAAADL